MALRARSAQALTPGDVTHEDDYRRWNPRRVPARPRLLRLRPRSPRVLGEEPPLRLSFKVRPSLSGLASKNAMVIREKPLIDNYDRAVTAFAESPRAVTAFVESPKEVCWPKETAPMAPVLPSGSGTISVEKVWCQVETATLPIQPRSGVGGH